MADSSGSESDTELPIRIHRPQQDDTFGIADFPMNYDGDDDDVDNKPFPFMPAVTEDIEMNPTKPNSRRSKKRVSHRIHKSKKSIKTGTASERKAIIVVVSACVTLILLALSAVFAVIYFTSLYEQNESANLILNPSFEIGKAYWHHFKSRVLLNRNIVHTNSELPNSTGERALLLDFSEGQTPDPRGIFQLVDLPPS